MRNRNLAFCLRRDWQTNPGGDIMQMHSWEKELRNLGNQVRLIAGAVTPEDLRGVDAVFLWHLERLHESMQPWLTARKLNIPVLLATTCWHTGTVGFRRSLQGQAEIWCRCLLNGRGDKALQSMLFRPWWTGRKALLRKSALLLANSEAEQNLLCSEGAEKTRVVVIPNIIETDELDGIPNLPAEERTGIVCIGHFCPRKNQLGLIRALQGTGLSVTFIGGVRPMHRRYLERCVCEAAGQHHFAGSLSHQETLRWAARSRLAICSSVSETPGIGNLEAGALGCSLVLPDLAPVREYFGDCGNYIDPAAIDPDRIVMAYRNPPPDTLKKRILTQYTRENLIRIFETLQLPEAIC